MKEATINKVIPYLAALNINVKRNDVCWMSKRSVVFQVLTERKVMRALLKELSKQAKPKRVHKESRSWQNFYWKLAPGGHLTIIANAKLGMMTITIGY